MTGFTDPSIESQQAFRVIMDAMARPTTVHALQTAVRAPAPLSNELAAVALTLADNDVTLWLDAPLRAAPEVIHFLRFHTGAKLTDDPAQADFALASSPQTCPPLSAFRQGVAQFPEQSTTIVIQAQALAQTDNAQTDNAQSAAPVFTGPGIAACTQAILGVQPLPADFHAQIALNRAQFPLGVDLIFVAPGAVAALPRSSAPITRTGAAAAAAPQLTAS